MIGGGGRDQPVSGPDPSTDGRAHAGARLRRRGAGDRRGRLDRGVGAAADGAQVGLFEKADTVGGTSAWSGGTVWLPNNRHEVELGFSDSREEVLTYRCRCRTA